MSGNTPTSTPAAGQAANPFQAPSASGQVPETQPGGQGTEPQFVTKAEVEALRQEILSKAQSLVDKSNSRIETKVKEIREQMGGLSPEQEATLRANLAKENPASSPAPAQGQPAQAQPQQGPVDPAIAVAFKLMEKEGVTITDQSEGFKNIAPFIAEDGSVADPAGLLAAVNAEIKAEKERQAFKNSAPARVPAAPTTPAAKPVTNSREAWKAPDLFK